MKHDNEQYCSTVIAPCFMRECHLLSWLMHSDLMLRYFSGDKPSCVNPWTHFANLKIALLGNCHRSRVYPFVAWWPKI